MCTWISAEFRVYDLCRVLGLGSLQSFCDSSANRRPLTNSISLSWPERDFGHGVAVNNSPDMAKGDIREFATGPNI
jgi:hypothetical protein